MRAAKIMTVKIGDFFIEAESLKQEIELTSMFKAVNGDRLKNRKAIINYTNFMNSVSTLEFIEELKVSGYDNPVRRNGKTGKASKTYCCVTFAIFTAQQASARFNRAMIEEFVTNRILQNRQQGSDLFVGLNVAIDLHIKGRDNKDNRGLFIQCSKRVKEIIKPDGDSWNTATAEQLLRRVDIEYKIITVLETGLVEGKEGIYSVIDSVSKLKPL